MEFYLDDDISDEEAIQLIKTEPPKSQNEIKNGGEEYEVYENENQPMADPFASYFYSQQVAIIFDTWNLNTHYSLNFFAVAW